MTTSAFARAAARLDVLCPEGDRPDVLGVAVSGGSDSLALLHMAAGWGRARKVPIRAVTVNHGLRPEAGREAAFVAEVAADLGVPHRVMAWTSWDGQGNLQEAARQARRALIASWAEAEEVETVALGHTRDDQAETVVMNLARGSGVDGLAGIPETFESAELRWIRPLLGIARADLRSQLRELGETWVEDPSNADDRFTRVKARKILEVLGELGLSPERLVATADRMQAAQEVLTLRAYELGGEVRFEDGDFLLPLRPFRAAPRDTRNRTLAALLQAVSGAAHRPRYKPLEELAEGLAFRGQGGTLLGVLATVDSAGDGTATIRLTREHAAVDGLTARPGEIWDRRWCLEAADPRLTVRALGAAAQGPLPEDRPASLPRSSLMATPALWDGETLVAAPLAGLPGPAPLQVRCRNILARRDPLAALRHGPAQA